MNMCVCTSMNEILTASTWLDLLYHLYHAPKCKEHRRNLTTSHITHHGISPDIQAERREHREENIMASHQTYKPKEENTEKKFVDRVLGPDRRNLTTSHITHHGISPDIRHHISPHHTLQAERREHKEEVLGPSSWAGWLTTPRKSTSFIVKTW